MPPGFWYETGPGWYWTVCCGKVTGASYVTEPSLYDGYWLYVWVLETGSGWTSGAVGAP